MKTEQVFISHTSDMAAFPENRSFVQAALDAVCRAGMAPVDMRHFPAREVPPAEHCRQRVRDCEVYVGILGFCYGSLVPGTSVSYTELEFQEAGAAGLPRLVFLLDDGDGPLTRDDAERRAAEAFRQRLSAAGVLVRTFASGAGLELEVFHALTELHGGPQVVPRELPAAAPHFACRRAELAKLDRLLEESASTPGGAVMVALIDGMAGAGKTTLAVRWAHQVADRFPGGHLYVNLRGHDPSGSPVPPAEAIRGFLDALGLPAQQIPAQLEEQARLYRSCLAGRHVLIVMDNARDAAQVRPLLPGSAGCVVLVTSRNRLTGLAATEGAQMLHLDALTSADARELLVARLGRRASDESEAMRQLAKLCSGLPLALSIVAAQAAARPQRPLADMARQLARTPGQLDGLDTGDPAASVRTVFSWSYHQLSDPAARLFRLLGTHPGPDIAIPAAASLAATSPSQAVALLGELADSNLITEHAWGRYAFHDLLRAYAVEQAQRHDSRGIQRAAERRLLDHYLRSAHNAAVRLYPRWEPVSLPPSVRGVTSEVIPEGRAGYPAASAWFKAERPVLLAAIRLAASNGWVTPTWQLSWTIMDYLDRRGHWSELTIIQEVALQATQDGGDRLGEAHAHESLGISCRWPGRYAEAETHLEKALEIFRELGDEVGQADTLSGFGWLSQYQGEHEAALDYAGQALALYTAAGNHAGRANALSDIAWSHTLLHNDREALKWCVQALALLRKRGDRHGEAHTLDTLGYAHYRLGNHEAALYHCQQALELHTQLGDRYHQAAVLDHLGDAHKARGNLSAARGAWQDAVDILGHISSLGRCPEGYPDAEQIRVKLRRIDTSAKNSNPRSWRN